MYVKLVKKIEGENSSRYSVLMITELHLIHYYRKMMDHGYSQLIQEVAFKTKKKEHSKGS